MLLLLFDKPIRRATDKIPLRSHRMHKTASNTHCPWGEIWVSCISGITRQWIDLRPAVATRLPNRHCSGKQYAFRRGASCCCGIVPVSKLACKAKATAISFQVRWYYSRAAKLINKFSSTV
jgi:hypothetical protein